MSGHVLRLRKRIGHLPIWADRPWAVAGVTAAIAAIAIAARFLLDPVLPSGFPFLTFLPAFVVVGFLFGIRAASAVAILCGFVAWYWFLPPKHSWALDSGSALAMAFYVFIAATNLLILYLMQMANATLRQERTKVGALVESRDLLFRELQHRVSNNLQTVASLINLQRSRSADPHVEQSLGDAARRIATIGRTTRSIYDANTDRRPLDDFVRQVCSDFSAINGRKGVSVVVAGQSGCTMASDDAVPIALVITECLANAYEHAFPETRGGTATVRLSRADHGATIVIHDDGVGLPDGFDIEASESLGLLIARALSAQVGGTLTMSSSTADGTVASFNVRDASDAASI